MTTKDTWRDSLVFLLSESFLEIFSSSRAWAHPPTGESTERTFLEGSVSAVTLSEHSAPTISVLPTISRASLRETLQTNPELYTTAPSDFSNSTFFLGLILFHSFFIPFPLSYTTMYLPLLHVKLKLWFFTESIQKNLACFLFIFFFVF